MKLIYTCISAFLLGMFFLANMAQANREDRLFKKFPANYEFKLKNGEKVLLPFHIYNGQSVLIGGYADLNALTESLKPHHVVPAALSSNKGLVSVYIINYLDTVIGSYHEIVVMVAIQRSGSLMPGLMKTYLGLLSTYVPFLKNLLGSQAQDIGFFAWKLWVDSDIALRVGHEVWGYPKSMAKIDMDIQSRQTLFYVADQSGGILRGGFKRSLPSLQFLSLRMDLYSTTPIDIKQTTGRALVKGRSSIHAFSYSDRFEFNPKNLWGKIFHDIQFQPLFWQHTENVRSVAFVPENSMLEK